MEERTYKALRQEVKSDLEQLFPGAILLTLEQAAKVYGFRDKRSAKDVIGEIGRAHV